MNIIEFTTQLAQETGELLLNYYQRSGIRSHFKTDRTVVTEADFVADQHLTSRISQTFPNDGILSEEANTIFPKGKSTVWILDPLDGTTNFSLGLQHWGVSISRVINGYPDLGVLYFPLINEMFTASKGGGAYLNGTRLQVKPPNSSQPTKFFSCCSRAHRFYNVEIKYKTRILGSAAYGLVTVARGSAILAFEVTPKIWDFSASWLITQEAGGLIAPLEGEKPFPLIPESDYGRKSFPLISAPNPELITEAQSKITKK